VQETTRGIQKLFCIASFGAGFEYRALVWQEQPNPVEQVDVSNRARCFFDIRLQVINRIVEFFVPLLG
jgi:hypothetical protein